jgi:four helix bundle protein
MPIKDYKDLDIWNKGIDIVDKVYLLTDHFPKDELYCLTSQLRRAAISIPSNIAEGFARHHKKEYTQFLYVALGSCAELDTQLIIAGRRKYIAKEQLGEFSEIIDHESRMLMSLIRKL